MILLDTSGLFAALDQDSRRHAEARTVLAGESGRVLLSPFVLAELDYLITARLDVSAELRLLEEVAAGVYELVPFAGDDVAEAKRVIEQYLDLGIGLTDASLVVLAGRFRIERILTLDERHFRAMRTPQGRSFTLLPADV